MCDFVKNIRCVWAALCVTVLCITLRYADVVTGRDVDIFLVWAMMLLSFPSGWIIVVIYFAVSHVLCSGMNVMLSLESEIRFYSYLVLTWLAFFAAGYVQWFKVIPALIRR